MISKLILVSKSSKHPYNMIFLKCLDFFQNRKARRTQGLEMVKDIYKEKKTGHFLMINLSVLEQKWAVFKSRNGCF